MEKSVKSQRWKPQNEKKHTSIGYSLVLKGPLNGQRFGTQEVNIFWACLNKDTCLTMKKDIEYGESHHAVIPQLTWGNAAQRLYFNFKSSNVENYLMLSNRCLMKVKQINKWIKQGKWRKEGLMIVMEWNIQVYWTPQLVQHLAHQSVLLNEPMSSVSLLLTRPLNLHPHINEWLFWPLEWEFSNL